MTSLQKDKNVMNKDATRAHVLRASVAGTIACAFVGAGALTVFSPTLPAAQAVEVDVVTGVMMANSSHPHGPNLRLGITTSWISLSIQAVRL